MKLTRRESKQNRHRRIRGKVNGFPERPRLSVFRSHQHIYAQVIDDTQHHTLVAASTLDPGLKSLVVTAKRLRLVDCPAIARKVYQRLCLTVVVTFTMVAESTSRGAREA